MSRTDTRITAVACRRRPDRYPWRCDTCPVMAWPHAGASPAAMRDFADHARCPHDHPGGPVAWDHVDN